MNWDATATVLVITSLTTGLVTVIAALSAAFAANRATTISETTDHKADTIIKKTEDIHDLANSNLAKAIEALAEANKEITGLKTEIRELKNNFEIIMKAKNAN